jgi:hypothetical protein
LQEGAVADGITGHCLESILGAADGSPDQTVMDMRWEDTNGGANDATRARSDSGWATGKELKGCLVQDQTSKPSDASNASGLVSDKLMGPKMMKPSQGMALPLTREQATSTALAC